VLAAWYHVATAPRRANRSVVRATTSWSCWLVACLVLVSAACSDDDRSDTGPTASLDAVYASGPTSRCLEQHGVTVTELQPTNTRFQAVRDLAQRSSLQASVGDQSVAIAFTNGAAEVKLLAELLQVPDDPYLIVVEKNVLLMYDPMNDAAFRAAMDCLRE
jgi:hypothetical protein